MQSNTHKAKPADWAKTLSLPVLFFSTALVSCNFLRWHSVALATLAACVVGIAVADRFLSYVYVNVLADVQSHAFREGKDSAEELLRLSESIQRNLQRQLDAMHSELAHWKGEVFRTQPELRAAWIRSIAEQYAQSPAHEPCSACEMTGVQQTGGLCEPCPECNGFSVKRKDGAVS